MAVVDVLVHGDGGCGGRVANMCAVFHGDGKTLIFQCFSVFSSLFKHKMIKFTQFKA